MVDAQFDLSPEELRKVNARRELRAGLKQFYMKEAHHPYKQAQGGYLFDPAIQRFMSARATKIDHFKPTLKGGVTFFMTVWIPIFGFAYYLRWARNKQEQKWRSGQVAYKDRDFKFI